MERKQWLYQVENDRVILNPDHPDAWQYYQDTDEVRLSDSGCPGAGDGLGPFQVLYNRTVTQETQQSPREDPRPSIRNPSHPNEMWE